MKPQIPILIGALLLWAIPGQATHTEEDLLGNPAFHEDFEDMPTFFSPDRPEIYTDSTAGTGAGTFTVRTDQPVAMEGTQAVRIQKTSTGSTTFGAYYDFGAFDLCDQGTGVTEFDFIFDTYGLTAGSSVAIGWGTNPITDGTLGSFALVLNAQTQVLSGNIRNQAGTSATGQLLAVAALDTLYHFRIQGIDCDSGSATFLETVTGSEVTLDITGAGHSFAPDTFFVATTAATTGTWTLWMDDWTIPITPPVFSGSSFCPIPSNPMFAYNYVEGVSFVSSNNIGISFDDYYEFLATSDNADYLAKVLDPAGSTPTTFDAFTHLTIEAGTDNQDSVLEFRWTFVDPTPYLSGETLDEDAKGNGESTAMFAEFESIRFEEGSNDWIVTHRASNGGSVAQSGPAFQGGNPNDATSFIVDINSDLNDHYIAVRNLAGVDLLNHSLAGGHNGDGITGLWIVGQAGDAVFDATTGLNNDDTSFESSCIFFRDIAQDDLEVLGDPGATADDPSIADPPTSEPGAGEAVFPGVDMAAFSAALGIGDVAGGWIVGLLLIVALSGGLGLAFGAMGFSLGGLLGLGMGVAFNLIPLWFILFLVLIGAAVVVFFFRGD